MSRLDIRRRLDRAETVLGAEDDRPDAILMAIVDGEGNTLPALGWKEAMCSDPVQTLREPGESDEALEARAIAAAKAKPTYSRGAVPVLVAVIEE